MNGLVRTAALSAALLLPALAQALPLEAGAGNTVELGALLLLLPGLLAVAGIRRLATARAVKRGR